MTFRQHSRRFRHATASATSLAPLIMVVGFLAPTISSASAATTTTTPTSTTTTTTKTTAPGTDCSAPVSGTALSRTAWTASTNAPSGSANVPANALDGKLATRFSTNEHQAPGLYLEVNLGAMQSFQELSMVSPNSPTDYARGYELQVSTNNTSWASVATCTGTATPEIVSFPTQTAHYIKVVLTASTTSHWWSIDELNLNATSTTKTTTKSTTTTTRPTTARTTTSLSSSANPASVGQAVTYTAKVVPLPSGGTVNFFGNRLPILGCHKVPVSITTGQAVCSTTYFSGGHLGIQAFFSGHLLFAPSSSGISTQVVKLPLPGYWLATRSGQVYGSGAALSLGGMTTSSTTGPLVGMAATPSAKGYWMVTANGTVRTAGDAKFYGDLPNLGKHVMDVVAIAPTTDGHGYYLVGADGGFFTFGDAKFHGSVPGLGLHVRDVVGMVASPGGRGYLLVGSDGGVFTFGTTRFYGSLPGIGKHVHDIRAILPSSTGRGYILVGADGGAFNFGTGAKFHGSLPGEGIKVSNIVGLALSPDNGGYYMAGAGGHVYGFGDASAWGKPAGLGSNLPVAAIAGT